MTEIPQSGGPEVPSGAPATTGDAVAAPTSAPTRGGASPDHSAPDKPEVKSPTGSAPPAGTPASGGRAGDGPPPGMEPTSGELKADKVAEGGRASLDADQPVNREPLIYRAAQLTADRQRRPRPNERLDRFDFLRARLEEIIARDEDEPVTILGVRSDRGLPAELLPSQLPGRLFIRSDQGGWPALKRSSFSHILSAFIDAARDQMGEAVFLDWMPYSEKAGDLARLIDRAYDDKMDEFEARLKEKRFHFLLVLAIDRRIDTTTLLELNPRIRLLPWTDLWLSEFCREQSLSFNTLAARISDPLRRAGKWDGSDDDNREMVLSFELQQLVRDSNCSEQTAALAAITKVMEQAEGEISDASFRSARKELARSLGNSESGGSIDPVMQVMLVVAAFAGGARVDEYYALCRALLPGGPAEMLRLPPAVQEAVIRDSADAERMNRERAPLPGWAVVFDAERDSALSRLQIRVVDGQSIQIGGKWKIIDLKREITREHPGLVHSLLQRMRDRRLLLILSEAQSLLLVRVACAIRDACDDGFNDEVLASALIDAQHGISDLGTPIDIVAKLFPGRDPEDVLKLLADIRRHRQLAQSLEAIGEPDAELERSLRALEELDPEVTDRNLQHRYEKLVAQLREASVRRLTHHILCMRAASSAASERRRPIVASMLRNLETMLSTETYVSMLSYMLAVGQDIDVLELGKLLQREVARANNAELGEVIASVRERLGAALAWANAPHKNWLIAFDPVRAGKAADDRIRAVAVYVWDTAINGDVRWRIMPYERMTHLRLVCRLFARPAGIVDPNAESDVLGSSEKSDEALIGRVASGFFNQEPADWLAALAAFDAIQDGPFLHQNVINRIADCVWVIMAGAAEAECATLQSSSGRLMGELLAVLTSALKLGPETDFQAAAERVVRAQASPANRFNRRWLPLYGLFWPAMLAHWRFTAFGLQPFQPGSEADRCFRVLLGRIVDAAPRRSAIYRDGCATLAAAAVKCAARAESLRAPKSAELYRLKADRLHGLQAFFDDHATRSLIAV
ncbi:hypothetical protein BRADO0809 [Bradyrhizobium sp. ORS 278]|nr:hypothetical protein BRADO0809 [Bradyrhizobium sp. ORS 278]